MSKYFFVVFYLATLQIQGVFPQVLSRPALLNLLNRQENILEGPINYIPQPYNQLIEAAPVVSSVPLAVSPISPSPSPATTVVTDCSPSVCKNLANTLQLMIVCNLLQNTQGGSDLAVQLAAPIINEVISSPNFSCGCANPLFPAPVSPLPTIPPSFSPPPTVISPNYPNMISPNIIPNYINTPFTNANGLVFNLLQ